MLIKDGRYLDLWPEKLDLEKALTAILYGILALLGGFCKALDSIPETIVNFFGKHVFTETTERPENELVNRLHAQYDRKVDAVRVITSSLSFGLLLACIGLTLTIIYLLMH